ncbi:MAG: glycosyltransferase family 2 protein [Nitrososphaerales archaeon]
MDPQKRDTLPSFTILVASFLAFYTVIEGLLFSNRNLFGVAGIGNDFVMLLISFLNIAPAGIFAFSVVSAIPERLCSNYNETNVISYAPIRSSARTALLYTTYNDFMQNCAKYNVDEASKLGLQMFILDDSTSAFKKREIDRFGADNDCMVLRRDSRKGYKAGAINNWTKLYGQHFEYIFILDSDSRAACEAIEHCIELAKRDPRLGLVQTRTLTMTSNPSRMTTASVTIQHAHMAVVQNAMKNMGTSPYYGHNALVKLAALKDVGGLIEESNEDYKTLARMHNAGYESLYAESAVTWEETPPDYFSARKRALRWARDAVGQLGLLRFNLPLAMSAYLIYGWATYMANAALLSLFLLLSIRGLSLQVSTMGMFGEVAGIITMIVIILWPLLSVRVSDPILNVRSVLLIYA